MNKKTKAFTLVMSVSAAVFAGYATFAPEAKAQYGQPSGQVSMTLYPVVTNEQGQQYVVTKMGPKLPLPGAGLPPGTTQVSVYRDQQSNYWYTDKTGQPVEVTAAELQQYMNRMYASHDSYQQQSQQQQPQQQQPQQQQQQSSGGSAAMTGLAAAGGAAMGAALTNSAYDNNYGYHGVPYGVPMYRGAENKPYYMNSGGNQVYVNNSEKNATVMNQWNQQGNWNDKNQWANQANAQQKNEFKNAQQNYPNAGQNAQNARSAENGQGEQRHGMFGRGGEQGGAGAGAAAAGQQAESHGLGSRFKDREGGAGAAAGANGGRLGGRFGGAEGGEGRRRLRGR
ncbi:MAG: hypothetical protein IAF58_14980 [Leptolyngbya sp.]|nr:hypothetical protein [Candidatus Melainabacteria bacterium]